MRDRETKRGRGKYIYRLRGQENQRGLVPSKINDDLLYRELEREMREREREGGEVRKRERGVREKGGGNSLH